MLLDTFVDFAESGLTVLGLVVSASDTRMVEVAGASRSRPISSNTDSSISCKHKKHMTHRFQPANMIDE